MVWVREGYCCGCGECCAHAGNPYRKSTENLNLPCPHYIEDTKQCDIHGVEESYWDKGCKDWPSKPGHVDNYPSCTYTFSWVDTIPLQEEQ